RQPRAGAGDDAHRTLAAVSAVPGLRRGHRLPAGPGPAPGRDRRRPGQVPRRTLLATAGAAAVRHGGRGRAAVLLRSRGEAARRLPRRFPRVLGSLPAWRPGLLRAGGLPGPADLEPPVVRSLPVGLHRRVVAALAPRPAPAGTCRPGAGTGAVGLVPAVVAGAGAGPGATAAGRPFRLDPCAGGLLVQPRPVLRRVPARLPGGTQRRLLGRSRTPALAGAAGVARELGRAGRLHARLRGQRSARGTA